MTIDKILTTNAFDTIRFEKADDNSIGITLKTNGADREFYFVLELDEVDVFQRELHQFISENFK
jgi:hypothetical protein